MKAPYKDLLFLENNSSYWIRDQLNIWQVFSSNTNMWVGDFQLLKKQTLRYHYINYTCVNFLVSCQFICIFIKIWLDNVLK